MQRLGHGGAEVAMSRIAALWKPKLSAGVLRQAETTLAAVLRLMLKSGTGEEKVWAEEVPRGCLFKAVR